MRLGLRRGTDLTWPCTAGLALVPFDTSLSTLALIRLEHEIARSARALSGRCTIEKKVGKACTVGFSYIIMCAASGRC